MESAIAGNDDRDDGDDSNDSDDNYDSDDSLTVMTMTMTMRGIMIIIIVMIMIMIMIMIDEHNCTDVDNNKKYSYEISINKFQKEQRCTLRYGGVVVAAVVVVKGKKEEEELYDNGDFHEAWDWLLLHSEIHC